MEKNKIRVVPKDKKDEAMAFILQKIADKWIEESPGLLADIGDLAVKVVLFNKKWGTNLKVGDILQINKD